MGEGRRGAKDYLWVDKLVAKVGAGDLTAAVQQLGKWRALAGGCQGGAC